MNLSLIHIFPVFVKGRWLEEDRFLMQASGIICFGCMEQIYSYDVLIGEKLDAMAMAVHRFYSDFYGEKKNASELWKEADIYEKMSSRAMAIHLSLIHILFLQARHRPLKQPVPR